MDNKLFLARIEDTLTICHRTQKPKFFGFISAEETFLAKHHLENINAQYCFFGGYDNAQRVMLGCFPEWLENRDFPITPITFTFRKTDVLRHRDFLGALMSLGIARETVGDILIENGRAVIFVCDDIKDFILSNISKIGRVGVLMSEGFSLPLPECDILTEYNCTVASERLDCVVSGFCCFSRSMADRFITDGLISVNSVVCEKATKTVCEGDVITVRGKGKFIISSLSRRTKKGRIILQYKKFS